MKLSYYLPYSYTVLLLYSYSSIETARLPMEILHLKDLGDAVLLGCERSCSGAGRKTTYTI